MNRSEGGESDPVFEIVRRRGTGRVGVRLRVILYLRDSEKKGNWKSRSEIESDPVFER
ncbi:hypothetical protein FACS189472_14000 [Alphaproteobacteria bacterium]|nr:hypothetical protein FACS189472_14000 [Alphaproteobacteria bacterium]